MEFFDCHCHTERSDCAEDVTLEMYVDIAAARRCSFAITDHSAHLFYPPDQKWGFWTEQAQELFRRHYEEGLARCAQYVAELRAVQTDGMLVGLELDVLPDGTPVFDPERLGELDFVLGALHYMRSLAHNLPTTEVVAEHKARVLRLCELGVDAIAHPFREWSAKGRQVPESLIAWTVEAARDAGIALELNSHNVVPECDVPMARLCAERGVRLAIGTDTHRWHEFGGFRYHERILREAGIAEEAWPEVLLQAPLAAVRS